MILSTCTVLCLASGMITTAMAEDTADDASLSYELASEDQTGADFSCIIDENGEVYWALAVSSFDKLNAMVPDDVESAKIQVLPQNDEEYPYLYPDSEWKIFVNEAEMPSWFSDESVESITAAFEEWKAEAYSIVDVNVLLDFVNPQTIEVTEESVTDEIQEKLDKWADVDSNWMTCYVRNAVPTTTQSAVGMSIANDAWNYIVNMVWTQTGEDLAGHSQVDLIAAFIGSAFPGIEEWEGYFGSESGYPFQEGADLLQAGFLYSNGLYSAKQVKEFDEDYDSEAYHDLTCLAEPNTSDTGSAFACLVDEDGNVYWQMGTDYCSGLLTQFDLDPADVVQINVTVDSKGQGGPGQGGQEQGGQEQGGQEQGGQEQGGQEQGGQEQGSKGSYFTTSGDDAIVSTLGDVPEWYNDEKSAEIDTLVREAYSQWQQELLEMIDVDSLNQTLTGLDLDYATPMTEDLFEMLKEWVAVWNEEGVAGYINIEVSTLGYKQVGPSVWGAMDGTVLANYKSMDHEGCPGPTTSSFIAAYALEAYGKEIDAATDDYMGSTMNDAYSSLVGSFIKDFCLDEAGNYKYQVAADLWEAGCIPFYDGEYWYLVSGPDYDPDGNPAVEVIYSATNDQLLDDSFTYEAESAE